MAPSQATDFETAISQADDEPVTLAKDRRAARRALIEAGLDESLVDQFQAHVEAKVPTQGRPEAPVRNAGQAKPGNTLRTGKTGPQVDKNALQPDLDVNLVLKELRRQKGFTRDVGRLEQKRAEFLDAKAAGLDGEAGAAMRELAAIQASIDRSVKAEVAAQSKNDKKQLRWSPGHQEVVLSRAQAALHVEDKVLRSAFEGSRTTPTSVKPKPTKDVVPVQEEESAPAEEKRGARQRLLGWASKERTKRTGKLSRHDFDEQRKYEAYVKEEADIRAETKVLRREKLQRRGLQARQTGILGTMVSGIRFLDLQAKRVVVVVLLLGAFFAPLGILTFAGWSIIASAMVIISAVYFVFLNGIKVVSSALVGFISFCFAGLAAGFIAIAEPILIKLGKETQHCTFADGTKTDEKYAFCSGRQVASEGFIPASDLKAIDIPLLDPHKLMPEMDPKPIIQYLAEFSGLHGLDLGSFFARTLNGPVTDFIAGGSIYRVILVFVIPTAVLIGFAYVKFVRPALQAAGVKH